jgi:hypothetical protein
MPPSFPKLADVSYYDPPIAVARIEPSLLFPKKVIVVCNNSPGVGRSR